MLEFRTEGFKGFAVKFSPYDDSRLAVATGQNYGLVGNGRLWVLQLGAQGISVETFWDTKDILYDVCWSEMNPNHLLASSGDGSIKLFDTAVARTPINEWFEHGKEVFSVQFNFLTKSCFLTSSWDGTIKVFEPSKAMSILSIPTHSCTYSAQFSPHEDGIISGVTSDGKLHIFDVRAPPNPTSTAFHPVAHPVIGSAPLAGVAPQSNPNNELLTHDWNKYRPSVLAVGGVDRQIRIMDLRNLSVPVGVLTGHDYAVRKVAWSPHHPNRLLSASYDMTVRLWDDGSAMAVATHASMAARTQHSVMNAHTEFATGVDWCLFGSAGWAASTAWDERVLVWDTRAL